MRDRCQGGRRLDIGHELKPGKKQRGMGRNDGMECCSCEELRYIAWECPLRPQGRKREGNYLWEDCPRETHNHNDPEEGDPEAPGRRLEGLEIFNM